MLTLNFTFVVKSKKFCFVNSIVPPCHYFCSVKNSDLTPRPTYPLVKVHYIFCFYFLKSPLIHTYTLINSTHSSSLLYSTHHTLFVCTSPNAIDIDDFIQCKLVLILILLILTGPTSTRCYRVILCPAKSYHPSWSF